MCCPLLEKKACYFGLLKPVVKPSGLSSIFIITFFNSKEIKLFFFEFFARGRIT